MKNTSQPPVSRRGFRPLAVLIALVSLAAAQIIQAANGAWTNNPVSGIWTNVLNWNGGTVPGTINNTANNGVDTASIALFTNAITGAIGTAASPIIPDDGTVINGKARMVYQLNFDGVNCGAYVFSSPSAYQAQTINYTTNGSVITTNGNPETGVLSLCVSTANSGANGSYIGAAVTKPQNFLIPVQIRLPSSTTGQYGFTNNATSPLATYYFNNLFTYPGATGRGLTYIFAGSNTGTNTVATLSDSVNQTGGTIGILKQGSGKWILTGANTFIGASVMNISGGTLEVQNAAAFGSATTVNVNSGTLQIDAVTLNQAVITMNGGTLLINGSATVNGIKASTALSTVATLATTSATDVMTVGNAVNQPSGGASDTVLHIAGPGTVLLSQQASYVGKWSIDAGTNQLGVSSGLGTGANLNIGSGATFDVTPITTGGGTYSLTTAALSASGVGTGLASAKINADPSGIIDLASGAKGISLTITPATFTGDSSHPALYIASGTLSLSGNPFTINNAGGSPLGVGTYKIIQQASGPITSGGGYSVVGVTGSGVVSGNVASIVVTGSEVDLVVSAYVAKNLVWTGNPANANWDIGIDASWLNGLIYTVFNNSDNVTFNSVGSTNPVVNLTTVLAPGSVTVDSPSTYTFSGSGAIVGQTGLVKKNTGTLVLNTVNTYGGGTIISNGVLQLGVANAISGTGAGNLSIISPGILDMNGSADSIDALTGNGTVDTVSGGTPILAVGNNDNSGTFAGIIKNTSGALSVTKNGNGVQTLSGANSYAGPTTLNAGTLQVNNYYALGGGAGTVTINNGILDVMSATLIGTLAGAGTIENNSTATTNVLVVTNSSTYNGIIADGSGGGGMSVLVSGGTLRLNGTCSYSGGTIVGAGASLAVGPNPGQAGTGGILVSNGATVASASTGGTASEINNNITTASGATANFTGGGAGADGFNGNFIGDATTTNVFHGQLSLGVSSGTQQFSNFLGVVQFVPNATAGNRILNSSLTGFVSGGDNTTFDFEGGNLFTKNANTFSLGALIGGFGGGISGPTVPGATYWIGAKGTSTEFSGYISGSNNIVKVGAGSLTLNGSITTTNTDSATYTNYVYSSAINYLGSTVVSNGVLVLTVPDSLTNSSVITLASSTAVLNASTMGYVNYFTDPINGQPNSSLVTNGILEVAAGPQTYSGLPQTLNGFGTINGSVLVDSGATLSPGLPTGTLNISNNVQIAGAVVMNLNRTNTPVNSELAAHSFTIDGTATLLVTNVGPGLINGTTYTLFSTHVAGFASVTLPPTDPTGLTNYVWANNIGVDGTIKLTSGGLPSVATNPTNIVATVSGNLLTLTWPTDHTGWYLQAQTNSLANGLKPQAANWVDVPNSQSANTAVITIDPAKPTVFYRLSLNP